MKYRRAKQIQAARLRRLRRWLRRRLTGMRTSSAGIQMIREFEGCRLEPYNDPAGFATVGVGHLIARRPVNQADRNRYRGFTTRDAEKLLAADLKPFEKAVRRTFRRIRWRKPSQKQFDALVSATFNLGFGVLDKDRSLGAALRTHDKHEVADALLLYTHAGGHALPGLVRRRKAEADLFRGS